MNSFLKWAGNKYRIIERIKAVLPAGTRLIEPFVGSGAAFLNTDYSSYLLADTNRDLIQLFMHLQAEGQQFIDYCRDFFNPAYNSQEAYNGLRIVFNNTSDTRLKSALFIYLNRHCFNGLCRYNSSNEFNTPFGRHKKAYFPEQEMQNFSQKAQRATFICADFVTTMQQAQPGDVIYCDPPFVPLSATANFTSYSADGFNESQQIALAKMAEELMAKGIPVVISNHNTEFTQNIYALAKLDTFEVQRFISSKGNKREKAAELLAIYHP